LNEFVSLEKNKIKSGDICLAYIRIISENINLVCTSINSITFFFCFQQYVATLLCWISEKVSHTMLQLCVVSVYMWIWSLKTKLVLSRILLFAHIFLTRDYKLQCASTFYFTALCYAGKKKKTKNILWEQEQCTGNGFNHPSQPLHTILKHQGKSPEKLNLTQ
jgi:hypothetical protein